MINIDNLRNPVQTDIEDFTTGLDQGSELVKTHGTTEVDLHNPNQESSQEILRTDWDSQFRMHSDINDHSIFDSKFSEGDVYSLNPYTQEYQKVEGRKGIFRDEESEQKFSFVSLPSKDYKLVDHLPLFEEVTTQLVESEDISTARVHIEDRTYEEDTKAIRTIHLLDHEIDIEGTGKLNMRIDVLNSTNSSWKFQVFTGAYRDYCRNSMVFGGERQYYAMKKHTSGFDYKEEVSKIKNAVSNFATQGDIFRTWLNTKVTDEQVILFFKEVLCKKKLSDIQSLQTTIDADEDIEKRYNQKELGFLIHKWEEELKTGMSRNLYTLYNALTNWSTHAGTNLDSYENEEGQVKTMYQKNSKVHEIKLRREGRVLKAIQNPLFQV
jgi:hypothetical protein